MFEYPSLSLVILLTPLCDLSNKIHTQNVQGIQYTDYKQRRFLICYGYFVLMMHPIDKIMVKG